MKTEIKIEELEKQNIFKVPNGYFEKLPHRIQSEIALKTIKKTTFGVPTNYFDTLADKIQSRIQEETTTRISLETLPKVNVFKVKERYFEELEAKTSKKVIEKPSTGFSISWGTKRLWAAAASILVVVSTGWFFMANNRQNSADLALNNVSKTEIATYLNDQDLSEIDLGESLKLSNNQADSLVIQQLDLSQKDILEHLKNQNFE